MRKASYINFFHHKLFTSKVEQTAGFVDGIMFLTALVMTVSSETDGMISIPKKHLLRPQIVKLGAFLTIRNGRNRGNNNSCYVSPPTGVILIIVIALWGEVFPFHFTKFWTPLNIAQVYLKFAKYRNGRGRGNNNSCGVSLLSCLFLIVDSWVLNE